jgi:preprotein translocase subunit SecD
MGTIRPTVIILLAFAACHNPEVGRRIEAQDSARAAESQYEKWLRQDQEYRADTVLTTGWYYIVDVTTKYRRTIEKINESYYLLPTPFLTVRNFESIEVYQSSPNVGSYWGLAIRLDDSGAVSLRRATDSWIDHKVGLVVDNKLLSAQLVLSRITGGITALNNGSESQQELVELKARLEAEMARETR